MLLVFNDATLQSEAKTVTLYISDDDSKSGQESDPASWQTSRNLVSDHEYVGEVSNGLVKVIMTGKGVVKSIKIDTINFDLFIKDQKNKWILYLIN